MIKQYRRLGEFNRLIFRGPGNLKIELGDAENLSVAAPGDVVNEIRSELKLGTLHLGYAPAGIPRLDVHRAEIELTLVVRDLQHVTVTGSGSVIVQDLDTDDFGCRLMGNGQIVIQNITADHLNASVQAKGRVRVLGDVESQQVILAEQARYEAEELVSDVANVRMTGTTTAEVHVTDELTTYLGGDTTLGYLGFPEVTRQGAGTIVRRRKHQAKTNRGSEHG